MSKELEVPSGIRPTGKVTIGLLVITLLGGCQPDFEMTHEQPIKYTCTDAQFEMAKKRTELCLTQGWGSRPIGGCADIAISEECTPKPATPSEAPQTHKDTE